MFLSTNERQKKIKKAEKNTADGPNFQLSRPFSNFISFETSTNGRNFKVRYGIEADGRKNKEKKRQLEM